MLYANHPHFIGFQPAEDQRFNLYADELEALAKFAVTTGKKELAEIMQRLAQYGRAKAQHNRGPVHFNYK